MQAAEQFPRWGYTYLESEHWKAFNLLMISVNCEILLCLHKFKPTSEDKNSKISGLTKAAALVTAYGQPSILLINRERNQIADA